MIICPRERFAGAFLLYLSNDAQKNYLHCPDRLDGELARGAQAFSFPAGKRADWIDTLHFYAVKVGGK